MAGEFVDYTRAPGFWFYVGMIIASDISANPMLKAKESTNMKYDFDVYEVFEEGLEHYLQFNKRFRGFEW